MLARTTALLTVAALFHVSNALATDEWSLTEEEARWLAQHDSVRLGSDPAWPPLDYRDSDGVQSGMCADYFRYAADKLGVNIITGPDTGWSQTLADLRDRKLDAITCLASNDQRRTYTAFSDVVTDIPQVIITRDDYPYISGLRDLNERRVAMVAGYATENLLKTYHPELLPVVTDTPLEALHAVATGQADAYVGVLAVSVHIIQNKNLNNLKVAAPAELPALQLRFGFRNDWPQMAALFSRAIATMTPAEHTAIAQHWVSVEYDPVIDYSLLWKVGGTLAALLLLAMLWIRQVSRQNTLLTTQRNALSKLTRDLERYGDRVSRELDMARQTQEVLLPDTGSVLELKQRHAIDIDSRFEPCSELGGDFWGIKNLDSKHAAILTVDFSGHGVNAALNTFRLHALLESEKDNEDNPALYLEQLNRRLSPLLPPGQYATMFYGIIDRTGDRLIYTGAATPNPLVFLPDGDEPIVGSGEGFPLGMFDDSTYENRELPFPMGASLLLYSDAATEGKLKQGGRLEEDGLIDIVRESLKTGKREKLVQSLNVELDSILTQPLTDDLTIVCATRLE